MNKLKKLIYFSLILSGSMLGTTGCSDFLEEDASHKLTSQYYTTTPGLDDLVTGMYQNLKFHFNYEWAYATTIYGTDEFSVGGDRTCEMWNSYGTNLNSALSLFNADPKSVWDNMYGGINSANTVIENVPKYYDPISATKNTRLGEGYFMRAFDYFKLVKQYGGVPLKLTQTTDIQYEYTRNSAKEVYDQIISDFTEAYKLLPATPEATGRITKWAAAHFLAKAYLYRASELYSDWNAETKTDDLNNAVRYADSVIVRSGKTLAPNFSDLWNFTTPDGANEKLSEIILAAQFSNNTTTQGRFGNQLHLHFPSIYNNLAGMQRDLSGGREFQRCRTTDYAIDVYDRVNDSRFWKSFKTCYSCNKPASAPKWTTQYAPSNDMVGKFKFSANETSIQYIVNDAGDARYTSDNINYLAPHTFVRYFNGEAQNLIGSHGNYGKVSPTRYVALSKFMDGSRNSVASQFGQRDGILARLSETYLIAAEAYGRLGKYAEALPYINTVRDRAAYKSGEDRSFYVDGGVSYKTNTVATTGVTAFSYSDKNTYYLSNNIPVTTAASSLHLNSVDDIFNSTKEFYNVLGAASNADKFLQFILNERSRELMGELMRWEDLSRTKTLISRATLFNDEAKPVDPKHYLRPVPQSFLDAIQKSGRALTAEEKAAMQNQGW
ncbi:RagB/SusD family nutrient uptake outer membrane protein [Parabacteroides sp. FAFU027]|uniref:RagB/SusD family nutrient uptake outer membrane protein n=1 Tax=Parabacteroides sp. FAFU027 TaxID=2922715 RepID=UPI001FB03CDD|nr:RagB/SusD family nutrient uptake outer membrane protein [Parabacteroides sp. FAFU027]